MTTSSKQRRVAIRQCKSVEKLAEAVERVNGVDADFCSQLKGIKIKMQEAYSSICEDDLEITEEVPILQTPASSLEGPE